MAENKNGLVVDPNDPNYKIKPGDSTEAVQQTNQSELVVDPNDPNYQVKPANMVAEPTTPSTTDTGQTTPNSNEEPKQETTPVANNGEQQATQTTGTQNDVTTPKANTPQVNPADYTFTESELQAMEQQQAVQGAAKKEQAYQAAESQLDAFTKYKADSVLQQGQAKADLTQRAFGGLAGAAVAL